MALLNFRLLLSFLVSLLFISSVIAQVAVPDHPLIEDGSVTAVSVTDNTKFNSGGTITVNGRVITVPDNLIVQFPATWANFKDFAASDIIGKEVSVAGNIVNGKPIAAQIEISQLLLQFQDGIIESINFDGTMKIVGGPTIRINDPNGKFGAPYAANPLFTADDENPSIVAYSGWPMCVPRSATDTDCPADNRPPRPPGAATVSFTATKPKDMVPFLPGDYIEYSGILVGGEIICYAITATSVQVLSPVGGPVYIRMEDANIGVFDPVTPSEFGDTKFVGFVSDPSVTVTISAIDVDPCTGLETDRIVGSSQPVAGNPRNRFIWRSDSTTLSHYTREYRIKVSSGVQTTNQGLLAGQYVQPVTEWIYPEPLTPGIITPPINFDVFDFLANGWNLDGKTYGQLSPWPGATAPTPKFTFPCPVSTGTPAPAETPTGTIAGGPTMTALPGSIVTLIGSNTNALIPESDLTYAWSQASGPAITIQGTGKTVSFTAPAQAAATPIILRDIQLIITNKAATPAIDSAPAHIIVSTDKSVKDIVTINSYTWTTTQGGTLSVTASTNYVVDGTNVGLQLFLNPSTAALTMAYNGNGVWSFSQRSTKKPAGGVTVKSTLGGTDTKAGVTARRRRRDERNAGLKILG